MTQRHLFICNTPFQIMMALAFRMTILKNEQVELIISNIIANSERLFFNIERSNIFDKIYYYKDYELDYGKHRMGQLADVRRLYNRKKIVLKMLPLEGKYDAFYATDTLPSIEWIYDLLISKNPSMKMFYYEEGPISVLCDQGNHFKPKDVYNNKKSAIINKILNIKHINGHYSAAYVSVRDQMPDTYFEWRDMPMVPNDLMGKYVGILNDFWKYTLTNEFKNKVVYLEESYYTDGRENRDIEIVNDLIDFFGKERVIAKLHPRTRDDRFAKIGIESYKKSIVPWELIALNGDLEGTISVCIGSGAIMYPKLYWNIDQISVSLVDCKEYHFEYLNDKYYKMFAEVCTNKQLAFMPKTKTELFNYLDKYR